MNIKVERQSNIELLRIVLLFMIILLHLNIHGLGLKEIVSGNYSTGTLTVLQLLLNSFVVVAVNTFVFISGFYGITFNLEKLIHFVAQAVFYSVGIYLISVTLNILDWDTWVFLKSFFPISQNTWWFLTAYIALYLIAPILNKGIELLDRNQLFLTVAGFLILNSVGGFFFNTLSDGYGFFSFVSLYLLARYLNKYKLELTFPFVYYSLLSLLIFAFAFFFFTLGKFGQVWQVFYYHNPLLIISSVALFYTFKKIHFTTPQISQVSSLVLGVYLIHDHYIIREYLSRILLSYTQGHSNSYLMIFLVGLAMVVFIGSAVIEKIRQVLFTPLIRYVFQRSQNIRLNKTK